MNRARYVFDFCNDFTVAPLEGMICLIDCPAYQERVPTPKGQGKLYQPVLETGSVAWEATILPLNYWYFHATINIKCAIDISIDLQHQDT